MKYINKQKLSLELLQKIHNKDSVIYFNDDIAYKLFNNITENELKLKSKKIKLLSSTSIPNVILPNKMIVEGDFLNRKFIGYSMDYVSGKTVLDSFLEKEQPDLSIYLKLIKEISYLLRGIHNEPQNIVIGDLHLDNILVDENSKLYFIDSDSYSIDGLPCEECPAILWNVVKRKKIGYEVFGMISQKTDRLNLLLSTIALIFFGTGFNMYTYDQKSEQIKTLKNIREFVEQIYFDERPYLPNVPYIDELISDEDISKKIIFTNN